jgi:hypothetical protein
VVAPGREFVVALPGEGLLAEGLLAEGLLAEGLLEEGLLLEGLLPDGREGAGAGLLLLGFFAIVNHPKVDKLSTPQQSVVLSGT